MKSKRSPKSPWRLAVVASLSMPWAFAGTPQAVLSLNQAIRLALAHNPVVQASEARREAAAGRSQQARAWPNPELELSAEDVPANHSRFAQAKHMAGVYQTIPGPGKKKADREAGAADVAAGAAEAQNDRAELVRDVKTAYCRVQVAERSAAVTEDLVKVAESAAAAAAKRNAAGQSTLQEQLRAEIELEHAKAERLEARQTVAESRQQLALLLGRPEWTDARLTGSPAEACDRDLAKRPSTSWLPNHPAMVAARARLDLARAAARRAEIEPRSDVKVGLAGGRDEAAEESLMEFRVSIPLPLFDRNQGKRQETSADVREAEARIAATQQQLLTGWRTAADRYQTAAAQVAAHRDHLLPKSEEALRLVQTGFEEGKFGLIDLLDTQRTAAEARLIYQKKLLELNSARAELESFVDPLPKP